MKQGQRFNIKEIHSAMNFLEILRRELGVEIGHMERMRMDSPPAWENFRILFNTFKEVCSLFDENCLSQKELKNYNLGGDVTARLDSTKELLRRAHELLTVSPSGNRMKVRFAETYRIMCSLSEEILPNLKASFASLETSSK